MDMDRFFDKVQERTENYLTRRKAKKKAEKMNRTFLSEALGWLDAILFAVVVIFLVNQFLFQFFKQGCFVSQATVFTFTLCFRR